jgi:hypothetical protein
MRDYYKTLEISEDSSIDEIKQAYRRLAKKYHPDVNKSHEAHSKFIQINEAYEVLLHEAAYNQTQSAGQNQQFDYEEFIKMVREEAQRQARMRYDKFKKEHEAFRESGLYDIGLLLQIVGRALVPLIGLAFITIPVVVSINEKSISPFFYMFFFWIIGGILLIDAFQKRKGYFNVGKFYYSFQKIFEFYAKTDEFATHECFYCKGLKANSLPYKITMVKVRDIQLNNEGPLQHYARYKRKEFIIKVPRSRDAFINHSIVTIIRIVSIMQAILFFPISSFIWRFIGGLSLAWFLSWIFLLITSTRSKTAYLFSYGMIIKILIWLGTFVIFSKFQFTPFDIRMTEYIKIILVVMVFVDSFLEQALHSLKDIDLFKPLLKKDQGIAKCFVNKCRLYLEIPLWTFVNPLIRWIF